MQWFRLYAEFATDPVVQSLSFDDQRHFVMLLCLKCAGVLDKEFGHPQIRNDVIRKTLGLDGVAFQEAKTRLCGALLINGDWQPTNWKKRQYISDSDPTAAERQRRFRARNAPVTRESHPSESDTDNRVQKEEKKNGASAPLVFPNGFAMREWEEWIAHRKTRRWPCDPRTLQKQIDLLAKYSHAEQTEIMDRSINAGWQGLFHSKGQKPAPSNWVPPPDEETNVSN